ncbi:MAG: hypothetical protein KQH57_00345 [Actinomycetales bacterium]|nr:hypothetical protein [Actinomycetales bacterium]
MRLYRVPVTHRDDGVAVDALPGVMGTTEASVARVPAGATLTHAADQHRQLLVVVSGEAVVEAADHPPVTISTGTLLLWERGEVERTRAVTDLVAVVVDCVGMLDLAGRYPEVTPEPL